MWKRCATDEIGVAKALKEDKKLTNTTSLFEIMDNSNKALKRNDKKFIKIIDTNELFGILDNGSGFELEDAPSIMTQYKRSSNNGNSLSHYGIGLKSTIHYKLSNGFNYGYMISSCNTEDGDTYCVFSITLDEDDCIQISNPHNPPSKWTNDVIYQIIPEGMTGTLLLLSKNNKNITKQNEKSIIKQFTSDFLSWNNDNENYQITELSDEKIMNQYETTFSDICKLWSPLIEKNLTIYYNGYECKSQPFIQENDKLLIDTEVFINTDNKAHILIFPEYNIQYTETNVQTGDEQPLSKQGIKLGRIMFYIADKGNEKLKRIQYSFDGDRILQRNKFSRAHTHQKHTHLTMRTNCIFTDINYVKKEILEAKKTPDDMLNVEPSSGKMKFINNSITRFCLSDDVLKTINPSPDGKLWYAKNGGVTTHTYDFPPQPSQSRNFNKTQKRKIRDKYHSCCAICNMKLDDDKLRIQYDHIIEYAKGGKTEVENGRPLCVNCHERRTHGEIDNMTKEEKINYLKHIIQSASDAIQSLEN
jgi:hypothetical protein